MRKRVVQPEFWSDEDVIEWPRDKRFTYLGLWMVAEDTGCLPLSPRLWKVVLWPADEDMTVEKLEAWSKELVAAGRIVPYDFHGKAFGFIAAFHRHQRLSHPQPPKLPIPPWLKIVGRRVTVNDALLDEGRKKRMSGHVVEPPSDSTNRDQSSTEDVERDTAYATPVTLPPRSDGWPRF